MVLWVEVENGDTELKDEVCNIVAGIIRWYILVPCWGIETSFPVQPIAIPGEPNVLCLVSLCSLTLCAAAQENIVLDTNDLAETLLLLSPPCWNSCTEFLLYWFLQYAQRPICLD